MPELSEISELGVKEDLYNYISGFPLLSRSEERWEFAKGPVRRNTTLLINSNLRMVYKFVGRTIVNDVDVEYEDFIDLFNSGVLGLYEAIKRFNSDYNVRFATYAHYWVRVYVYRAKDAKRIVRKSNNCYIEEFVPMSPPKSLTPPSVTPVNIEDYKCIEANADINVLNARIAVILPTEELKRIYELYFYVGQSARDVGRTMGLTRRQVQYRVCKIRDLIKEEFKEEDLRALIEGAI